MDKTKAIKPSLPPENLKKMTKWFGGIIARPLDLEDHLVEDPHQKLLKECTAFIRPSSRMQPLERLETYAQQYWWRLEGVLSSSFPLTAGILGGYDFEHYLVEPFLKRSPPQSFSLHELARDFVAYTKKYAKGPFKRQIEECLALDLAFEDLFRVTPKLAMSSKTAVDPEKTQITLQPSVALFSLERDWLSLRERFLKEKNLQNDPYPMDGLPTEKKHFMLLSHDITKGMCWFFLEEKEFLLLSQLKKPRTLLDLFGAPLLKDISQEKIQAWFQKWTACGWLTCLDTLLLSSVGK